MIPSWGRSSNSFGEDNGCGQQEAAEVGMRVLVVAGGNAAPLFEAPDAALDGIA
jgi:hypothetical protein